MLGRCASILWLLVAGQARAEEPLLAFDHTFPTGFRVVVAPDPALPVVGIAVVIDAGSAHEPPDRAGLAHVVEHLAFYAEHPNRPPFGDFVGGLGCEVNGATTFDTVSYQAACPSVSFPFAWQAELRRLADPLAGVDDADLLAERRVVQRELAGRFTDVGVHHVAQTLAFGPEHPYGHLPIGLSDAVASVTLDDARRFVAERYRPAHTTIAVTGDVSLVSALRILIRTLPPEYFVQDVATPFVAHDVPIDHLHVIRGLVWPSDPSDPSQPQGPGARPDRLVASPVPPVPVDGDRAIRVMTSADDLEARAGQEAWMVTWTLPPLDLEAWGDQRPWLAREAEHSLGEHLGPTQQGVQCSAQFLRAATFLSCRVEIRQRQGDILARQLRTLRYFRPMPYDVELAFRPRHHAAFRDYEQVAAPTGGRAGAFAEHAHQGYGTSYRQQVHLDASRSAAEQAVRFLERHAPGTDARLWPITFEVRADPDEDVDGQVAGTDVHMHVTAPSVDALPRAIRQVEAVPPRGDFGKYIQPAANLAVVQQAGLGAVDVVVSMPVDPMGPDRHVLMLGWEATWDTRQITMRNGRADAPMSGMFPQMYVALEDDRILLHARLLSANPEHAIEVADQALRNMLEIIDGLDFDADTWVAAQQDLRALRKDRGDLARTRARRAVQASAGLPPGSLVDIPDDDLEALLNVPVAHARQVLHQALHRQGMHVVAVGPFDMQKTRETLRETLFSSWTAVPGDDPVTVAPPPRRHAMVVEEDPERQMSEVTTHCVVPRPDRPVVIQVVGEVLRNRAFARLRVGSGLTYSPSANAVLDGGLLHLTVTAETEADHVESLVASQRALLTQADPEDSAAELAWATQRIRLTGPVGQQTSLDTASAVLGSLQSTGDLLAWARPEATIAAVTAADVQDVLAGCGAGVITHLRGPVPAGWRDHALVDGVPLTVVAPDPD